MELDGIIKAIREFPGITRKKTIQDVVRFLPTHTFASVFASEGEDAAAIEFGDDLILFAADGIMESLLKTNPFYAGYFAVLVNVNDIAAMGGKALAMVDVISVKDDRICSQMLKGMERAVKKFNVPIVGGHTHPDCMYHAIDISIIGSVPKDQVILSSTAKDGDDIVFVMDTDGFYPPDLRYAWDTTTNKEDRIVQEQMAAMCDVASEKLTHAAKDMSNPGCIGTLGMLLETSSMGGYVDVDKIPTPKGVDFIQWILSYQGCGFVFSCPPENSQRIIDIFKAVKCDGAIVGKVDSSQILRLRSGDEERVLFDFNSDIITGCKPRKQ
ncbi:MAG: methanogenesis marker 2 protein [Methanomassiliicoccales archaeon]|uniref:methanogenesis marker 2 protein n=1 Tax=Candidatus Methanarcanum hacksteinii TaxID=2911857 RepID=UPI00375D749A|nr:methanogenesis marker 2 protein [Methanomassiliicoccales archaeon]